MELMKAKHKVKCDFAGCPELAEYSFKTKGMLRSEMFFCTKCANEIYSEFSKMLVPKAVEPPFKNPRKVRRKNEN